MMLGSDPFVQMLRRKRMQQMMQQYPFGIPPGLANLTVGQLVAMLSGDGMLPKAGPPAPVVLPPVVQPPMLPDVVVDTSAPPQEEEIEPIVDLGGGATQS